jgi:hypothetical protein
MSAEKSALSPFAPPPSTEADYDAISAAVMETARGRWFLAEYAKRNRHADTEAILTAVDRIEAKLRAGQDVALSERVRSDLRAMAQAIARTRAEIAAIKSDATGNDALLETSEELDSIVHTTERATSDILAAAEQIQEIAWTAREHGIDGEICDALDQRATDIYTACTFQDLTGQRTRKVIEVLRFLEGRIEAMIEIWGKPTAAEAEAGQAIPGAALHDTGDRLDQGDIDRIMPAPTPVEAAPVEQPVAGTAEIAAGAEAMPVDHAAKDQIPAPLGQPAGGDTELSSHKDTLPAANSQVEQTAAPVMSLPTAIATLDEASQAIPTSEPAAAPEREQSADTAVLLDRIIAMVRVSMADADEPVSAAGSSSPAPQRNASTDIVLPPLGIPPETIQSAMEQESARVSAAAAPRPATQKVAAPLDDPGADILMPVTRPISVADAVEQMLMSHSPRSSSVGTPTRSVAPPAPQEEEQILCEPVVTQSAPAQARSVSTTEPSMATSELTKDAAATVEVEPEPISATSEQAAPEPASPTLHVDEPVPGPVVAAPKPETAAPPPPAAAPVRPPAPPSRNAAIAAIAALSDEEKIALFS